MTPLAWKVLRAALYGLAASALLATLWFEVVAPRMGRDIASELGRGDYRLTTTDGDTFTEETLRGAPSAVFFGFTHCPEVCPTTLSDISIWQDDLGDKAKDLRIWFVTVDPERDNPQMMKEYLGWVPSVTGVSGSSEEIAKAERAFKIFARKIQLESGGYTMDHTAYILLFDDRGRFADLIGYQEKPETAVAKLRKLLGT